MSQENIPAEIFRAYDIRGIVDHQLTPDFFQTLGKAFGAMMGTQKAIAVGYDGRLSGPKLAEGLIAGLLSAGKRVINLGMVPTPCLYHATYRLQTGNGIMITGSHNPPQYNGCKMILNNQPVALEIIEMLYQVCISGNFPQGKGQYEELDFMPEYISELIGDKKLSRAYNLVVDSGNGVTGGCAPDIYRRLGANVQELFCEVDGNFPNHHPDPGKPENMKDLQDAVIEHSSDLGFAFDGDGDRLGLVTGSGKIIFPDRMMMLFARDLLLRIPSAKIVYDVKCTSHLQGFIENEGGEGVMWKTGHSLIKRKMKEINALLGGEMSGHFFFAENWSGADDALLAGVRLLQIVDQSGKSIENLCAELPDSCSTPEINLQTDEQEKFKIIEKLEKTAHFGKARLITIDGLRVEYDDGWGLVRASNTSPTLVLRFEANDQQALQRIKEIFAAELLKISAHLKLP